MAEIRALAPPQLLLDERNPRLEQPNVGQHRALQEFAKHLGPELQKLAEDIVNHGTDPSSLPIVTPAEGKPHRFVVVEGNRRLAALRALENPESLSGAVRPGILKRLRQLSKRYQQNPVESLVCFVVNDRDGADHWLELRHTGKRGGAGLVRWGSDDVARFRARSGISDIRHQALDFLVRRGDLKQEERRGNWGSTLLRLLRNPVLRNSIGFEMKKGQLFLVGNEDEVANALMHVVTDVKSNLKVTDVYHTDQIQRYASTLPSDVQVAPIRPSGEGLPIGEAGTPPVRRRRLRVRPPRPRDTLIPRDILLSGVSGRALYIEGELRNLSLEQFTNAVSVLFRVFVELSVDEYAGKHNLASVDAKLAHKMNVSVGDLVKRRRLSDSEARPVRRACQKDYLLAASVSQMHEYVHNKHVFPGPSDLRAAWDSLQPFVSALWME